MTRLFNDPTTFATEMASGFALANPRWVMPVPGGVIRSTVGSDPKVALVIGGGSGHYPAFGGLVGPGLADGAVMGDMFASPSVNQVVSVAEAVDTGRGVLLGYGNYMGDVLHFEEARERLRARGTDCRSIAVTDDIFSAPATEREKRRGIAGDLAVFKIAGAAAEAGRDLDQVERMARLANERTRTMGVAFSGCTLPGAGEPLFQVESGTMAVGLGIHGEQGIDVVPMPTADGLAEIFVDRLLAEVPDGAGVAGARVVPILNGLGTVKYEELFVVYRRVARLLDERGIAVVDPQVGEFCTSLDMAGASLTLLWLDDELEALWLAPAESPAFRTGGGGFDLRARTPQEQVAAGPAPVALAASAASRAAAADAAAALAAVRSAIDAAAVELGKIDAVAGDGDHGIGMQRGIHAAAEAAAEHAGAGAGLGTTLVHAGEAWSDHGGGTSGALWGAMLRAVGESLGDEHAPDAEAISAAVGRAAAAVTDVGKAAIGDKTMVDAIAPFAEWLQAHVTEDGLGPAWLDAARVATEAARATADLVPRIGRARTHGERAIGTPDPGAVSFAIVVGAVSDFVAR